MTPREVRINTRCLVFLLSLDGTLFVDVRDNDLYTAAMACEEWDVFSRVIESCKKIYDIQRSAMGQRNAKISNRGLSGRILYRAN